MISWAEHEKKFYNLGGQTVQTRQLIWPFTESIVEYHKIFLILWLIYFMIQFNVIAH